MGGGEVPKDLTAWRIPPSKRLEEGTKGRSTSGGKGEMKIQTQGQTECERTEWEMGNSVFASQLQPGALRQTCCMLNCCLLSCPALAAPI